MRQSKEDLYIHINIYIYNIYIYISILLYIYTYVSSNCRPPGLPRSLTVSSRAPRHFESGATTPVTLGNVRLGRDSMV